MSCCRRRVTAAGAEAAQEPVAGPAAVGRSGIGGITLELSGVTLLALAGPDGTGRSGTDGVTTAVSGRTPVGCWLYNRVAASAICSLVN